MRKTLMATCLAVAALGAPQAADRQALEIEWIDVEGGAATLIVTPARETLLIDAGWPGFDSRDAKRIKAALDRRKLTAIDHFIVSHYHTDHYGGVPQLAALVPIRKFYDHGPMTELVEDKQFAEKYAAYRAAAKSEPIHLAPGSHIDLRQTTGPKLSLTVVAAHGQVVGGKPLPQNPACAESVAKGEDPSDNARSVAFVLRFGGFEFFDAGDLTWNVEAQLVCPADRVGEVDLYQVTHHGADSSNNVVVLKTLKPKVAVMNNGSRKGGSAEVVRNLKALPSLEALYQGHRNVATTADDNTAPELIANLEADPDAGHSIVAAVDPAARTYTVTNGRSGEARTFKVR
jgi:beta-lactamase superfamily II metal-dependent hydrolase